MFIILGLFYVGKIEIEGFTRSIFECEKSLIETYL